MQYYMLRVAQFPLQALISSLDMTDDVMASEMSSYSGGESSENCDSVSDTGSDLEADSDTKYIDNLYAPFEFENDTESQPRTQSRHAFPTLGCRNTPLYLNAQLTSIQSHLLVFQYSL